MNLHSFGRDTLGPIIVDYLDSLYRKTRHFQDMRDARILFASRAGVRIGKALELYCERRGLPQLEESRYFWVSRLMAAKGTWKRDQAAALDFLQGEFKYATLSAFVGAMLLNDPLRKTVNLKDPDLSGQADDIGSFLKSDSLAAKAVLAHFEEQSDLFEEELTSLMGGRSMAVVVDTGWQGTIQTILSRTVPEIDWWGCYFGRFGFESSDRTYFWKMLGLVFEADEVSLDDIRTSFIAHRHMIEDLFEPRAPSIERYTRDAKTDKVSVPGAAPLLADKGDGEEDELWRGVLEYINSVEPGQVHQQTVKAEEAWVRLSQILLTPTEKDARLHLPIKRSHDVGRVGNTPVLLQPEPRNQWDDADKRIADSLWTSGQIAIEYPPAMARQAQGRIYKLPRGLVSPTHSALPEAPNWHRAKVAVIMRTMDRPEFLERAIRSVQGQTYKDYVLVIVCDGGDIEGVKEVISKVGVDVRRTILVDNVVNRGMEAASNIGIRASDSDYVVIHDDDDTWEPQFLEKTVTFLESPKGDNYGGVITRSTYVSEEITAKGIIIHEEYPYNDWVSNVHFMQMAMENIFPPISFVFRRPIFDTLGGFDEGLPVLGDWDYHMRVLQDHEIGVIPERLARYHHRDVGNTDLFGNSVIADRDKHALYAPIVRNKFARGLKTDGKTSLDTMVGIGLHFDALIKAVREGGSGTVEYRVEEKALLRPDRHVESRDNYFAVLQMLIDAICSDKKDLLDGIREKCGTGAISASKMDLVVEGLMGQLLQDTQLLPPVDFDPTLYGKLYPELVPFFGTENIPSEFDHYMRYGRKEGRVRPSSFGDVHQPLSSETEAEGKLYSVTTVLKEAFELAIERPAFGYDIWSCEGNDIFLHPTAAGPSVLVGTVSLPQKVSCLHTRLHLPDSRAPEVEFAFAMVSGELDQATLNWFESSKKASPETALEAVPETVLGHQPWIQLDGGTELPLAVDLASTSEKVTLLFGTRTGDVEHFAHAYFRETYLS